MGNFSVNQVRQLYVVNAVKSEGQAVAEKDAVGTLSLGKSKDSVYFLYKGADTIMRSDLINVNNVLHAKVSEATDPSQKRTLKQVKVTLDSTINSGNPISGQDYILRICINPYIGMSDEEPYFKYGAVHATKTMTPAQFYTKLAISLFKNFSRELAKMLEFSIAGKVIGRVKRVNNEDTLIDVDGTPIETSTADGVTITEVEQEWALGVKESTSVNFTVIPTTITYDGDEVTWGVVTPEDSGKVVNNGKKIADLEYFCMGERGDQYRNIGWPYVIPTKYLVDPNEKYNIINIHYAYVGPNEGPQKSEKDITIVSKDSVAITAISTFLKKYNISVDE